jgi:hypothetical protein
MAEAVAMFSNQDSSSRTHQSIEAHDPLARRDEMHQRKERL